MTSISRGARALVLAFLLLWPATMPAGAQVQVPPRVDLPAVQAPAPQFARPDDPWIYRGTDIPVDKQWLFGELPNGLRYAVRRSGVPPRQVSIRVRIDAGSLHERDSERGFAHLIEHMTFRQSKYLGDGQAISHFQRLGARFGHDTAATTDATQTVYKLDLPSASPPVLDDSLRLISGMIREPALSAANLAADLPIVLAEGRESAGADQRVGDATRALFFKGQPLADRAPIGTVETLQKATPEALRAFHTRWYRPEKTVVVLVGDADPLFLASLVERYFADWQVAGEPTPDPDFGRPVAPRSADPANPVGDTRVVVEPGQVRSLTLAYQRPWKGVIDNLEYNRGLLIDEIALQILNRRLETRARAGAQYLFAGADRDKTARSTDTTYVALAPLTDDWEAALAEVRAVIADAVATPPSPEEIERELAAFDIAFVNQVEQSLNQASAELADTVVEAVNIREAIASPETFLEVFRGMRDRFTPEALHEHTKALFSGTVIRALLLTPNIGEASEEDLRQALLAEPDTQLASRSAAASVSFADLPPIGTPQAPVSEGPVGLFVRDDLEQVTFANGVRALLRRTENEPGRVSVRVRFGAGRRAFAPEEAVYARLGEAALVSSGQGPLGQDELDAIVTGRKIGFDFSIEDGVFRFDAQTRADDLADQLYLFAAKLAMPRWDTGPFERARSSALIAYDRLGNDPNAVINRDLPWLLADRDPRYATPGPEQLRAATPEEFRQVWSRLLAQGPVEVDVFGDFDVAAAKQALQRTFGALPPRQPIPPEVLARAPDFPAGNAQPLVLHHRGNADQAAAVVAWPTGGGSASLPQGRKLELLAQVFANRLLDSLREREGASYAPYVGSEWPLDVASGGRILALAQLTPDQVPGFFAQADAIARDLAEQGPSADELERVIEPMRQLLARMQPAHAFWLSQIQGAGFDRNRLLALPSLVSDYTQTSPAEMQALAARYLLQDKAFRVAVLPQGESVAATRALPSGGR